MSSSEGGAAMSAPEPGSALATVGGLVSPAPLSQPASTASDNKAADASAVRPDTNGRFDMSVPQVALQRSARRGGRMQMRREIRTGKPRSCLRPIGGAAVAASRWFDGNSEARYQMSVIRTLRPHAESKTPPPGSAEKGLAGTRSGSRREVV